MKRFPSTGRLTTPAKRLAASCPGTAAKRRYAGGTDLLIRLKNRLAQAPAYLVDIKKIDNLRYITESATAASGSAR